MLRVFVVALIALALGIVAGKCNAQRFSGGIQQHTHSTAADGGPVLALPDGSAGSPVYSFSGQTNLGLYRRASGVLTITAAGVNSADFSSTYVAPYGNLFFISDNSFDIGATGANRPRDVFIGRNLIVGGTISGAPRLLCRCTGTNAAPCFSGPANTSENTALTCTVPANTLGATGGIRWTAEWACLNDANAKTIRWKFAGNLVAPATNLATTGESRTQLIMFNRTATAQNAFSTALGIGTLDSTARGVDQTVDTTANQDLTVTLQSASAASLCNLSASYVELLP